MNIDEKDIWAHFLKKEEENAPKNKKDDSTEVKNFESEKSFLSDEHNEDAGNFFRKNLENYLPQENKEDDLKNINNSFKKISNYYILI